MKHVVLFEDIRPWHRPVAAWFLRRGDRVLVFDFTRQLKRQGWLRRLIRQGKVERIYVHPGARSDELAMQSADGLYREHAGHPLARRLTRLFGPEEMEPLFKHALIQRTAQYFYARLYLGKLARENGGEAQVLFVPTSYPGWDRRLGDWCRGRVESPEGVRMLRWMGRLDGWASGAALFGRRMFRYAACGLRLTALWIARRAAPPRKAEPDRCHLLYRISSSFQARAEGVRRFDFIVDGEGLTRENTAFVVTRAAEGDWMKSADAGGYRVFRLSDPSSWRGLLRGDSSGATPEDWLKVALQGWISWGAPEWMHETAGIGLTTWLNEAGVLENVRFHHYLYMNEHGLSPRWRNVFIRRAGGQSWNIAYSNGGCFLYRNDEPFSGGRDFGGPHRWWVYENSDHMAFPSSGLLEYIRSHPQRVGAYHDIGNMWAGEQAHLAASEDRDVVRRRWFPGIGPAEKLVAWFDTTFIDAPNSPSTYAEAAQWYSDILRLADEREDLRMVVKPSKDPEFFVDEGPDRQWASPRAGKELLELWGRLKQHPRVRLLGHKEDAQRVVFGSDLVVGFCFCAVTAEALSARKRAIWYEPGARWTRTPWGADPLLTAHGYAELAGLARKLLDEMSDGQYQAFLDGRVKGLVDSFMDGEGLSRLRGLLRDQETGGSNGRFAQAGRGILQVGR